MTDSSQNTDKEIWRKSDSYYSPSIHVTSVGGIGINCGGSVIVADIERWHEAGKFFFCVNPIVYSWRWKLAMWLLGARNP
jgi:hypothetical protein